MPREYSVERLSEHNMKFLFPKEIIARLDYYVATLPVDLQSPVNEPGELEKQLEILDAVLDHIELRQGTEPVSRDDALTQLQQNYLAHWILNARRQAYLLLDKQPDTPLGFLKGSRGMLSNLFFASWVDLTDGGKIEVQWERID